MATYYPQPASSAVRPMQYAQPAMAAPAIPAGTFSPGTKVQVGDHRVIIERYLSEGGFAHVYVVRVPTSRGGTEIAVLKRVAVPDKDALANMRTEVETMKKLKGHGHIVTYIDSHASQLKGGGYEVFLLMEFCEGGGLIDFMNTRLKNRLTEPEILKIFSDSAEGVACMHYLKPPLLHRDIKVENILISSSGGSKYYKLCDFGSSAPPRPAATSAAEGRLIEEDVQKHTTLQYRSPEMIDVYRKRPIDEKSDIWALGVFLYKLCYYTTPFEEQGQMAILTAKFKFPGYPVFSDRLKTLIATLLSEDPKLRPNIYQVLSEVCSMRGKEVPIKDIYMNRTASEARRTQQLPTSIPDISSPPTVGAVPSAPIHIKQALPDITPMRRGRPANTASRPVSMVASNAASAPTGNDPFAALDSNSGITRAEAVEELASRFPAVEDFSLLQDRGSKFQFKPAVTAAPADKRVTQALADEVFAQKTVGREASISSPKPSTVVRKKPVPPPSKSARGSTVNTPNTTIRESQAQLRSTMVSIGTMTSPPTSPEMFKPPPISDRPVWRVPLTSSPKPSLTPEAQSRPRHNRIPSSKTSNSLQQDPRSAKSSRPSLEGLRSAYLGTSDSMHRSKSVGNQSRSSDRQSTASNDGQEEGDDEHSARQTEQERGNRQDRESAIDDSNIESSVDYLRAMEEESASRRHSRGRIESESAIDDSNIDSNVDFLRSMEEEKGSKGHHGRKLSTHRSKHASMPAISLSNPKTSLAGKFGEAFKRFEGGGSLRRSPSPEAMTVKDLGRQAPVAVSESPVISSLEGSAIDETEELSPEMRRELERRQVASEERRIADAAAAYRHRLESAPTGGKGVGATSRKASAIQERVKNLLDESGKAAPLKRTAEGYGRYTGASTEASPHSSSGAQAIPAPSTSSRVSAADVPDIPASAPAAIHVPTGGTDDRQSELRPAKLRNPNGKPSAPPKPAGLRSGVGGGSIRGNSKVASDRPVSMVAPSAGEEFAADELEDFSKRYPSLSLEMVETEIAAGVGEGLPARVGGLRIRDV